MTIGFSGRIGSGKDTAAAIVQQLTPHMTWEVKKFAGKLKQIASILTGIPAEKFEDRDFKNGNLPSLWDSIRTRSQFMSGHRVPFPVREFLQKLGTDALRDKLHPEVWVNALFADYKKRVVEIERTTTIVDPNWLITDVRFPNEAKAIKDRGGIVIRMERGEKASNEHISESALDGWAFDFTVSNTKTIEELKAPLSAILRHIYIM